MAEPDLFGFTRAQVERLKRIATLVESSELEPLVRGRGRNLVPARIRVGILESSVSAVTALTGKPKVGTLNVYTFTSTGSEDIGIDETCYNFAPQAATTDRWTVIERDSFTGKWVITTQFCS